VAPVAGSSSSPPVGEQEAAGVAVANRHLAAALTGFRAHHYEDAIREFEAANRAAPSADFEYNIARCHELLSHYAEAVDYYRRYLRDKVDPPDRAAVESRITDLQRMAETARVAARRQSGNGAIRVDVTGSDGAEVFVDERSIARGSMEHPVDLAAGNHNLRIVAPGMQVWQGRFRLRAGEHTAARVALLPATLYETRRGGRFASYLLGGATVAAVGVGVFFGVSAAMQQPCVGDPATMTLVGSCDRMVLGERADLLYGVAAGLLLTTAIVYFIEAGSSRTHRSTAAASGSP